MEDQEHITHTFKWRKDRYPRLSRHYRKLRKNPGAFLHFLCEAGETLLDTAEASDETQITTLIETNKELIRLLMQYQENTGLTATENVLTEEEKQRFNAILDGYST